MRPAASFALLVAFLLVSVCGFARADQVANLAAHHRDGQTFLTWTSPAGAGWTYRVYARTSAMTQSSDLAGATPLGAVGDSTWCDVRLSRILAATTAYAIDSLGSPLAPTQGLFVATPATAGSNFYAVTAQAAGGAEDRTLVAGANSLAAPVVESVAMPRPVYQRTVTKSSSLVEIYTLWTSPTPTALFPAMTNRAGLAFDCGVVRGTAAGALMIRPHPYGQNFLLVVKGSGEPGEWRLALDDPPAPNGDHTWWYGHSPSYDVTSSSNVAPTTGRVEDYTFRRMVYTIEWARRTFPVDWTRVYASGNSMGGIGSLWLALRRPDLVAAVMAEVPRFDFSSMDDPNTTNLWNSGGSFRRQGDRLWGTVTTDLPTSDQLPVYDRLNMRDLAAMSEAAGLPPIITLAGKNDRILGWAEKAPFYADMERLHHGGYHFWDQRTHTSAGAWDPMRSTRYLYRFRLNRSYPALSHCSTDSDPGNGTATSGDSVGTMNGFVEWDTTLVDRHTEWSTTLRLRDLTAAWGTVSSPESLVVDVTPRRLQAFEIVRGVRYEWAVTRLADGAVVQSGIATPAANGVLTIPAVKVQRAGSELRVWIGADLSVSHDRFDAPVVRIGKNPLRGATTLTFTARRPGMAEVSLVDVSGRLVQPLYRGAVGAGEKSFRLDAASLSSGVYFVVVRQGDARATQRLVVIR